MLHCIGTVWARRFLHRERETERGRDFPDWEEKRHYLVFMSVGYFLLKKSATQRYWSNISVSFVSRAINISVSTAETDNSAVVLTAICRFMDHIGNSKEQSLCYLTLYELIHLRQVTCLWKELESHLSLFKGQSCLRCRHLIFFLQSFLKVCLACNLHCIYWNVVTFSVVFCFRHFLRGLF